MLEVTFENAHEYVYRNNDGREWIVCPIIRLNCGEGVYHFKYLNPTLQFTDIWYATLQTLRVYAVRKLNRENSPTNVLDKIKQMEDRFKQRKELHG